jgi:aspartyl-tRNA(Asn)/glutamyl-tRNA(Gln) amidotransferase subunit A
MNTYTSISNIRTDLKNGQTSCLSLVNQYLGNIETTKHLNAFIEVFTQEAIDSAKLVDEKIKQGKAGKLAGVVIGIKDNICYKNHKLSASSKILEGFTSLYSATVVERLLAEDAIIIGRLNCDEFAMGSSNETSVYGKVLHPLDNTRVPGGSSGGSAVAVAANLCHVSLGSETGGSVRQPASFCGLVGLKPTYGRVSRYGLIAFASSFDQIAPVTKTVEDMAIIMQVISGKDEHDATSSSAPVDDYAKELKFTKKKKIAYIKECVFNDGIDPEIRAKLEETIATLKAEGHEVEEVSFPYLEYMVPTYYVLTTAEASSNLSRFGGIIYGYRSNNATDIESTYVKSRTEGFGAEVKRRIMLGTFVLSAGYYDAYYAKAQKVRRLLQDKTKEILNSHDFILLPTTPKTAFVSGEISDPVTMYLEDIFTVQANLTGYPAISLPVATHSNGLPFGIQIMASKFKEKDLLAFSEYIMEKSVFVLDNQ